MTVLTQDEQKRQKIMARMQEHLVPVLEHCRGGGSASFCKVPKTITLIMREVTLIPKLSCFPVFPTLFGTENQPVRPTSWKMMST